MKKDTKTKHDRLKSDKNEIHAWREEKEASKDFWIIFGYGCFIGIVVTTLIFGTIVCHNLHI